MFFNFYLFFNDNLFSTMITQTYPLILGSVLIPISWKKKTLELSKAKQKLLLT